jgi:hypothetical protein
VFGGTLRLVPVVPPPESDVTNVVGEIGWPLLTLKM